MDTERSVEQQIQVEIELLREKFPQTQDLYREACALLFFRFGITPTANKLYQFVRKGSMSAPAEALAKFWDVLREKSRVRVEHPDLPADLRTAAGELTAALWKKAQAHAQEGLGAFRTEAQESVLEARAAQAAAEAERSAAQDDAAATRTSLTSATERIRELEQQLAAENATRAATEGQLQQAKANIERLQSGLEDARREFAAELDKLRTSSQLAEERFQAAEQRALLEIDRERSQAIKMQKDLEQVRAAAAQAGERHQAEVCALHAEAGQLRQRVGIVEGNCQAALSERDRVSASCEALRTHVIELTSQAAAHRAEVEHWRSRAGEYQRAIVELQAKAGRRPRKGASDEEDAKLL